MIALPSTVAADSTYAAVQGIASLLSSYAVPLVAVGIVAMALQEAAKKVFDLRTRFHAHRVAGLFKQAAGCDSHGALSELLQLTTGVPAPQARATAARLLGESREAPVSHVGAATARAVFELDTPQMIASMQRAADVALSSPTVYGPLFQFLTRGASDEDRAHWLSASVKPPASAEASRQSASALSRLRQSATQVFAAFETTTQSTWANRNQLCAQVLGVVIMVYVLAELRTQGDLKGAMIVPLSVVGGILSPFAKDLVSALQKVKTL